MSREEISAEVGVGEVLGAKDRPEKKSPAAAAAEFELQISQPSSLLEEVRNEKVVLGTLMQS